MTNMKPILLLVPKSVSFPSTIFDKFFKFCRSFPDVEVVQWNQRTSAVLSTFEQRTTVFRGLLLESRSFSNERDFFSFRVIKSSVRVVRKTRRQSFSVSRRVTKAPTLNSVSFFGIFIEKLLKQFSFLFLYEKKFRHQLKHSQWLRISIRRPNARRKLWLFDLNFLRTWKLVAYLSELVRFN